MRTHDAGGAPESPATRIDPPLPDLGQPEYWVDFVGEIDAAPDGSFVVVLSRAYCIYTSYGFAHTLARGFDAAGDPLSEPWILEQGSVGTGVAVTGESEFVVTWQEYDLPKTQDAYVGVVTPGGETAVEPRPIALSPPGFGAPKPVVSATEDLLVVGMRHRPGPGHDHHDLVAVWSPAVDPEPGTSTAFQVNEVTTANGVRPEVAAMPDGAFLVVWESEFDDRPRRTSIRMRQLRVRPSELLADGFEAGGSCAWSQRLLTGRSTPLRSTGTGDAQFHHTSPRVPDHGGAAGYRGAHWESGPCRSRATSSFRAWTVPLRRE